MAARRILGVPASSLSIFSAITFLGCGLTLLCGSFFLRWFSSWSCWKICASAPLLPHSLRKALFGSQRTLLCLQPLVFDFSDSPMSRFPDFPIPAATPRPCAPSLCSPQLCGCSPIRPSLHRLRFHLGCVW